MVRRRDLYAEQILILSIDFFDATTGEEKGPAHQITGEADGGK